MPHGKTYVVNSLDLVNSVQRNWKTLSFTPFVAFFLKTLCKPSKIASDIVDRNIFAEDGPWGLFSDTHNAVYQALAPGPGLDELFASVVAYVSASLDELLGAGDEVVIDLYGWIHQIITLASTNAVYGCQNPFKDTGTRSDFW